MEFKCKVVETSDLTPSVVGIKFTANKPFEFKAGQYLSVIVPHAVRPLRRPYSIASAPQMNPIELCIQRIENGPGSTYLCGLKVGDVFDCFSPYGFLLYRPKPGRDVVFVSTGTGLAPFRSILMGNDFKQTPPRRAICLLGVRTEDEILYDDDLAKATSVKWVPCLSRVQNTKAGQFKGRVTDYLYQHAAEIDWPATDFYLCGNGAMIDEVKTLLKDKNVAKEALYTEVYFKPPKS